MNDIISLVIVFSLVWFFFGMASPFLATLLIPYFMGYRKPVLLSFYVPAIAVGVLSALVGLFSDGDVSRVAFLIGGICISQSLLAYHLYYHKMGNREKYPAPYGYFHTHNILLIPKLEIVESAEVCAAIDKNVKKMLGL